MSRIEAIVRHGMRKGSISQSEAHAIMAAMLFTQQHIAEVVNDKETFARDYGTWGLENFQALFLEG